MEQHNVLEVAKQIETTSFLWEKSGVQRPKWPWETPPAPIPEEEIAETAESDVVVVGAGLSGLAAAARCTELGRTVTVLEQGKTWAGRGGHFGVVESKYMESLGIRIDKKQFARDWIRQCGNRCKEELVWLFINRSRETMDWLIDLAAAQGDEQSQRLFGRDDYITYLLNRACR